MSHSEFLDRNATRLVARSPRQAAREATGKKQHEARRLGFWFRCARAGVATANDELRRKAGMGENRMIATVSSWKREGEAR